MVSEYEMKERLKSEIDRLSESELRNVSRNQSSFLEWAKRTAKRLWDIVINSQLLEAMKDLWGIIFG